MPPVSPPDACDVESPSPFKTRRLTPKHGLALLFAAACLSFAGLQFAKHGHDAVKSFALGPAGLNMAPGSAGGGSPGGSSRRATNQPLEKTFDLNNLLIPREAILRGGPPVDGIPAITTAAAQHDAARSNPLWHGNRAPEFLPFDAALAVLDPEDRVLLVNTPQGTRVYPFRVLIRHEIVNDTIADAHGATHLLAVYCPLCDSVTVWHRPLHEGQPMTFGVSGSLYNSNVLLYDRQTMGLWSQILMQGVSGEYSGHRFTTLDDWSITTLKQVKDPDAQVMTTQTGFARDYERRAYATYFGHDGLMFPVDHQDDRLPNKTPVIGLRLPTGETRCYTLNAIQPSFSETTPDGVLKLSSPDGVNAAIERLPDGWQIIHTYWFAWVSQHPETQLITKAAGITTS